LKINKNWYPNRLVLRLFLVLAIITSIFTILPTTGQSTQTNDSEFIHSTYFGGSNKDLIRDGEIDSDGNIIITGQTLSPDFPVLNAFQDYFAGGDDDFHTIGGDAIIAKFDSNGELLWSTYFGGTDRDSGQSIEIDSMNNIYIVGVTNSSNLPVTNDSAESEFLGGDYDLFITKFAPNGSLIYSSYFGTEGNDYSEDSEMDNSGNLVIVGSTSGITLPVTNDAYQSSIRGNTDGFIARLANDCSSILYCTYFGGSIGSVIGSIDIDKNNNIVVAGVNVGGSFPLTENAYKSNYDNVYRDFYIAKFNSTNDLVYSTFFGGSHMDDSFGVSVDNSGNMYFSGRTWSDDYPLTNAFQETLSNDSPDACISAIDKDGQLQFSSYAGGSGWDTLHFVEVDSYDNVITTGIGGPDGFPISNAIQEENKGSVDVVLMILSPDGNPFFCSYFGGSEEDSPWDLYASDNKTLIVGATKSIDFPVSSDAYQQEVGGEEDGFFLLFDYIDYLVENKIETRTTKTTGFSFMLVGLAFFWLISRKTKR
jgi:hypothetical protein